MALLRAFALLLLAAPLCAQQVLPPSAAQSQLPSSPQTATKPPNKPTKPQPGTRSNPDNPAAIWYERAQRLTSELLEEDQWKLHLLGEALPARLAEAWWKVDQPRARRWLDESVQAVTFGYQSDKDEVREERLTAASIVFEVASRHDRAAAEKIAAMAVEVGQQGQSKSNLQAVNTIKRSLSSSLMLSSDSDATGLRPDDVGEMLVQLGDQNLHTSLGRIARKNPAAAQRLYSEALAKASSGANNYNMFFGLAQYAWPGLGASQFSPPLPEASQTELLNIIATVMLRPPQSDDDRQRICQAVSPTASRLLEHFPPAQAGMVQAAITACDAQAQDKPKGECSSVDDCLQAADLETKAADRAQLKMQAAEIASSGDEPIRALDIWDGMSAEERKPAADWLFQRPHYVVQASEALYKLHDTARIQRIFDDTPDEYRADAMLNFAMVLMSQEDKPYGLLMLSQARAALEKKPSDNPHLYTGLMGAYSAYVPEEAMQVLAEAINGLNQIKYKDPKDVKDGGYYFSPLGAHLEPTTVPLSLLEKDDAYVFASIKGLDDPRARASFRLGVLQTSLRKYAELKDATPKLPASPPKVATENQPPEPKN